MNNTPKLCPICSHPMIKVSYLAAPYPGRTEADPGWDWTCSNLPWKCREAALCAKVAELEALCRTIKTAWVEQDLVGFQEALDKVEAPHEPNL